MNTQQSYIAPPSGQQSCGMQHLAMLHHAQHGNHMPEPSPDTYGFPGLQTANQHAASRLPAPTREGTHYHHQLTQWQQQQQYEQQQQYQQQQQQYQQQQQQIQQPGAIQVPTAHTDSGNLIADLGKRLSLDSPTMTTQQQQQQQHGEGMNAAAIPHSTPVRDEAEDEAAFNAEYGDELTFLVERVHVTPDKKVEGGHMPYIV